MSGSSLKQIAVVGGTAIVVYMIFSFVKVWNKPQQIEVANDSYEMQRVKNDYKAPVEPTPTETPNVQPVAPSPSPEISETPEEIDPSVSPSPGPSTPPTATPITDKKGDKKTDKKDGKKDPKKDDKKKADQKKKAAKKPGMDVDVVDTSRQTGGLSQDPETKRPETQNRQTQVAVAQPTPKATPKPIDNNSEEEQKLSPSQWYSLLQAQPTVDNAVKFKSAKAELGEKVYYEIITKLLKDSQSERQKIGIAILGSDVSLGTFQYLVSANFDGEVGTRLKALLQSYGQNKTRFFVLAQALTVKEVEIVLAAQKQLESASKAVNAVATNSNQGGRLNALAKTDFIIFKAALARLMNHTNTQIAQNAKAIFEALWPSTGSGGASP